MISSRLQRLKLEIQSHRHWLTSFVADRSNPLHTFCRQAHVQHNGALQVSRPHISNYSIRQPKRVAAFATKELKTKKPRREDRVPAALSEIREAVQDRQIQRVAALYRSLDDKNILKPGDCRMITQCLHYSLRAVRRSRDVKLSLQRREETEWLFAFAEELVKDITKGHLAPHCQAHVHLIGFFKESGIRRTGVQFWQWLETQDELFVDEDVYGAAIELLAVNGAPLSALEKLYQDALSRFPGNFSAYHLSPEAIVPYRDRQTTLKGVPMVLLQGILTARLLQGDTRNAYLALDTALRLYPDQVPPRYFQLFLKERPLIEAYTVFAIACRGGSLVPVNQFRQLVTALRTSSDLSSPARHGLAVRAMVSILYMYIGAGGQVTQNVLSELIIGATQFLRLKGVAGLEAKKKQKIVDNVMDLIRKSISIFSRYGAIPGLPAFNSIITNLGGFGHSKQIIGIALSDVQALGLQPNDVTRRSVVTAAGTLYDGEYVLKAWDDLLKSRAKSGTDPDTTDFYVLIKNAATTGQIEFAQQEFERLRDTLPASDHDGIALALEDSVKQQPPSDVSESIDLLALNAELEKIHADLILIDEGTQDRRQLQDFRDHALPMTLLQLPSKTSLPYEETRRLYDELTTEQQHSQASNAVEHTSSESEISSQPAQSNPPYAESVAPDPLFAVSRTNMPFDILRYENWKAINYLLERAEASDEVYLKAVDAAIAAGLVPPQRTLGLSVRHGETFESNGLSDAAEGFAKRERSKWTDEEIRNAREQILRLRGRLGGDLVA